MTRSTHHIVLGGAIVLACAASFGAGLIAQESLEGGVVQSSAGGTTLGKLCVGGAEAGLGEVGTGHGV